MNLRDNTRISARMDKLDASAMKHYHAHYNNAAYIKATHGKSITYANRLLDAAMKVCGSPYYSEHNGHWGPDAIAFLEKFAPIAGEDDCPVHGFEPDNTAEQMERNLADPSYAADLRGFNDYPDY